MQTECSCKRDKLFYIFWLVHILGAPNFGVWREIWLGSPYPLSLRLVWLINVQPFYSYSVIFTNEDVLTFILGYIKLLQYIKIAFSSLTILTKIWNLHFEVKIFHGCLKWLFIVFLTIMSYYSSQKVGKPSANSQVCWIIKVSTHSKTLSHLCWKFIHYKAV